MNLRDMFDGMTLETVQEFVREGRQEDLHLDFKTVQDAATSRDDRKNLARALSGFGNADGGIVVWGVDCRKNQQGVDCASLLVPISPVSLFSSKLNSLTSDAVNPTVDGVLHRTLATVGGAGLAITLVPASDSGPHMAKAGEDRYYKRSGDSFRKMEHFDVEDMFGRRKRPVLKLEASIHRSPTDGDGRTKLQIFLVLHNTGRGSAVAPYVAIKVDPPLKLYEYGVDGNRKQGLPRLVNPSKPEWSCYGGLSEVVLHPGTSLDIAVVMFHYADATPVDLRAAYEVAAVDHPVVEKTLTVRGADAMLVDPS